MKKVSIIGILTAALLVTLVACGGSPSTTPTSSGSSSNNTVTMGGAAFNTTSITIPKGSSITFSTDQGGTAHNLVNGSNGQAHAEDGAATFPSGGYIVSPGKSWTMGPWNTAGTFHVTCTYHPAMNLTVTVTG